MGQITTAIIPGLKVGNSMDCEYQSKEIHSEARPRIAKPESI